MLTLENSGDANLLEGKPNPADLEKILAAWHQATERLQHTHEALRGEVKRLTDELEQKNRELARKNRLADIGQMASHIAHEVRNSLMPLTLYLSLLRRRISEDAGATQIVDKVRAGLTSLDSTVNDLLHFTAEREPHPTTFVYRELVREVCEFVAPQLAAQEVKPVYDISERLVLQADRDMLRRALLNLVLNSLDVMPTGGELFFSAVESPAAVELEVSDSGPGIDRAMLDRVFEPFFTTKSTGTGLGLAIVQRIAEVHGGDISVTNCVEGGAAFQLRLPRRRREAAA